MEDVFVTSAIQYAVFLLIVTLLVRPIGGYLARVFGGEPTWFDPVLRPLERAIYRLAGVTPEVEMDWKRYASSFLAFGLVGTLLLYVVLRVQPLFHTFDPAYRPGPVAPDLAMNTAISFATTTTWQAYGGETTLSYFSQVFGLTSTIVNMLLGEVVFGGLGSGLYSLVLIALVGVFAAGLMIGRTPEYLGKQVTIREMKLVALCAVTAPLTILPLAALALVTDAGLAGLTTNRGHMD